MSPVEAPTKTRLLRWTILTTRKKGMTEQQFHDHWTQVHAPKVRDWLAKYGTIEYRQYHTPSNLREDAAKIMGTKVEDTPVAEYDGYAEFLMRDVEDMVRAREDDYYKEVVAPDEQEFFDMDRCKMTVGWEEVYIRDGKVVSVEAGKANVTTLENLSDL